MNQSLLKKNLMVDKNRPLVPVTAAEKSALRSTDRNQARGLGDVDWKALKLFMTVARSDSLRSAAEKTGQAHNTISRKIAALEENLGRVLITRTHDGVRLTAEGQKLLAEVERMDVVLSEFARALGNSDPDTAGSVDLGLTEVLGAFWIAPAVAGFQKDNPKITLNLKTTSDLLDVLRMEVDIGIQCQRPTASGAIMRRLGCLHMMPFASKSYLAARGTPDFSTALGDHSLVLLETPPIGAAELDSCVNAAVDAGASTMRTPSGAAQLWAVASGAGIGWLPNFAGQISPELVALHDGMRLSGDLWLTYHPDAGRIGRIRRTIDWIVASFDPAKTPWFRDQFTNPGDPFPPASSN